MENLSWPGFLDCLDKDPDAAFADFYRFTVSQLRRRPPPAMHALKDDREDLTHNFVLHCVKDNFRVLHKYRDEGKPFGCWLHIVAQNFFLDMLREQPIDDDPNLVERLTEDITAVNPEEELPWRELLDSVKKALPNLDRCCRLLLVLAAREFTPKEMVHVLRLRRDQNKKVSDDLRYCRQKLKRMLADDGADLMLLS
jgi:RNA polymerase sigma factor (sigma-70 family)